jgi:hypothetical protein
MLDPRERSQPKKNRPMKRAFEEERHQAFDRQRRAEDVADVMRVIAQFMPNWNSMVMPVATPIAKLMPNSTPQNCTMRFQTSRPVIT